MKIQEKANQILDFLDENNLAYEEAQIVHYVNHDQNRMGLQIIIPILICDGNAEYQILNILLDDCYSTIDYLCQIDREVPDIYAKNVVQMIYDLNNAGFFKARFN